MKNISQSDPSGWLNFGKNYAQCPIGEFAINTLFSSMAALEECLKNEKYAEGFKQYLIETGSNFTWH
jgi:hypothetical protein